MNIEDEVLNRLDEYEYEFYATEKYVAEDHPTPSPRNNGILYLPKGMADRVDLSGPLAPMVVEEDTVLRARGGWTAPMETTYDLLPIIRAERGGIQYGAIDLAEDIPEAEPVPINLPAWLDPDGVREVAGAFNDPGRIPVGISVGDQPLTLIGSTQPNTAALARLLRMVADRLES